MYDECPESVLDALLRIVDDGNDSEESNFNKVEIPSIGNGTLRNDAVVEVRGTKRKRSDVSNKKDGKYQCQHCDYENTDSGNLRRHVEAKHEGVRYPCDQCDYHSTPQFLAVRRQPFKSCRMSS